MIEKLPVRFEALWLALLRVHVASAALVFPLCIALMTRSLQRRAAAHRWLGRVTGAMLLFALVPSGVVLALEAKGGMLGTLGFLLSAAIVTYASLRGIRAARERELVKHAHAMRHVVGQLSVAVTSRLMIIGLDALGMDPEVAYVVALWVPVLGSATVVELMALRSIAGSVCAPGTWFVSCVIISALHVPTASADLGTLAYWATTRVNLEVVLPLQNSGRNRKRMSRARPAPREHRVRILQSSTSRDQAGRQFIRFAVDVRFAESDWKTDDVVGCIYTPLGDVYVKKGAVYRPAAFLEGKQVGAVPGACKAAPARG